MPCLAKSYYDDILDLAIKYAGHDILKEETTPQTAGGERFSDGFEKRMKKIIGAEKRRQSRPKVIRFVTRTAAVIVILLIISTAVIYSSEALRVKFMNMFQSAGSNGSTNVEFFEVDKNNIPVGMVMPKYITDGFKLREDPVKNGRIFTCEFINPDGKTIRIFQSPGGGSATVDSDGIAAYETEIKGRPAFVSYDEKKSIILFNYETYDFALIGQIDISELTKIAESMID
jgi:hypothetical protein